MPIALDPTQTVTFSLPADAGVPVEQRPAFRLRHMSCRQVLKFDELVQQAATAGTSQTQSNHLLNQAMAILVAGWNNLRSKAGEIPFAIGDDGALSALDDVITPAEKWELVLGGLKAIRLAEDDKKKSFSQPGTAIEKSAPVV